MTTMSDFVNSGASNQAQVDANTNAIKSLSGINKIINGHMVIAQRGTSFPAVVDGVWVLDRWRVGHLTTAVVTISQDADTPSPYKFMSMKVLVTTADATLGANEFFMLSQVIEGHNVRMLFGRTFTLSFWVKSSKVGKYNITFRNGDYNQAYVAEYTINTANTWEKKTITVVGGLPDVGVWDTTTGAGLRLTFFLAGGTDLSTSNINNWVTGGRPVASGIVNLLDAVNNNWLVTGVQLELGEQATEFEIRSIPDEIFSCQRFYYRSPNTILTSLNPASATFVSFVKALPSRMRATPTLTFNPTLIDSNYVGSSPVTGNQWTANQAGGATATKSGTATFGANFTVEQIQIIILGANFNTPISRLQTAQPYLFELNAEIS